MSWCLSLGEQSYAFLLALFLGAELKKMKVLVAQSRLTLGGPMDCSLPGSSVDGILQARILEWVAVSSSGDLPDRGIEPRCPAWQADSSPCELPEVELLDHKA